MRKSETLGLKKYKKSRFWCILGVQAVIQWGRK